VLDALNAGDGDGAAAAMEEHLMLAAESLRAHAEPGAA
jgi:DNA-binding GntR family transcriptional regulator